MKIAVHMLTPYPPSNPNRDELGTPKTAIVGGALRQRISSQALKRSWRLSEPMRTLDASLSIRTRSVGTEIKKRLQESGVEDDKAEAIARAILGAFGKEKQETLTTSEVVIFGWEEWEAILDLADKCAADGGRVPDKDEFESLPRETISIDVAMFGRMRAKQPKLNVDAAVSVSHALTTHKTVIEADFWTAVDDLNVRDKEVGAGGMDEREFGSGVYYVYVIVDFDQLVSNLNDNRDAATAAVKALVEAMATTTPGGHRTSFAHQTHAAYLSIERGESVNGHLFLPAFESPVEGTREAIKQLCMAATRYAQAYGLPERLAQMSVPEESGSLCEVIEALESD